MYLHISRRSHSHTWGQQSSGVVSQEIHIKRLLVRCAVMSASVFCEIYGIILLISLCACTKSESVYVFVHREHSLPLSVHLSFHFLRAPTYY
jgi:hypothetical protein